MLIILVSFLNSRYIRLEYPNQKTGKNLVFDYHSIKIVCLLTYFLSNHSIFSLITQIVHDLLQKCLYKVFSNLWTFFTRVGWRILWCIWSSSLGFTFWVRSSVSNRRENREIFVSFGYVQLMNLSNYYLWSQMLVCYKTSKHFFKPFNRNLGEIYLIINLISFVQSCVLDSLLQPKREILSFTKVYWSIIGTINQPCLSNRHDLRD